MKEYPGVWFSVLDGENEMQLIVEFTCPECGLWTPGMVELPDDVDVRRQLTLAHECCHCDAKLEMTKRVADYLAAGWS